MREASDDRTVQPHDTEMDCNDNGDAAMEEDHTTLGNLTQPELSDKDECLMLLAHIGVERRDFKREHKRTMRNLVSEIYSPPRVTKMLSSMKGHPLAPGFALDITCHAR